MNSRYIYDEKTSSLYAPDGTFLKEVYCPKAMQWNQLITVAGEARWRDCSVCDQKVINLDEADVTSVIDTCKTEWDKTCIHASATSDKVIFLKDRLALQNTRETRPLSEGLEVIKTSRSLADINRAVGMGYWPDVRVIEYDTDNLSSKLAIVQQSESGHVDLVNDARLRYPRTDSEGQEWTMVIPFQTYYQYHQRTPIAAYLIPKGMKDGTPVLVEDPIEDLVGLRWNQGVSLRATDVKGRIEGRKVVIETHNVPVSYVIG